MLGFKKKYKAYDSIHNLPMSIYNEINKSNDYSLLVYEGKCKDDLTDLWAKIYDEDEETFGGNKKYKQWLDLKVDEAELLKDCYVNGNKLSRTFANIKAFEANKIVESSNNSSMSDILKHVSKEMGFGIDIRTISVYTFKSYLYGKV